MLSGVDVPEVIPIFSLFLNQFKFNWVSSSTWKVSTPIFLHKEANLFVLALFRPPITTIKSTSLANSLVFSCRSIVALQIVLKILNSSVWLKIFFTIFLYCLISFVVCEINPTFLKNLKCSSFIFFSD